jgi:hypothetical protein
LDRSWGVDRRLGEDRSRKGDEDEAELHFRLGVGCFFVEVEMVVLFVCWLVGWFRASEWSGGGAKRSVWLESAGQRATDIYLRRRLQTSMTTESTIAVRNGVTSRQWGIASLSLYPAVYALSMPSVAKDSIANGLFPVDLPNSLRWSGLSALDNGN